MVSPDGILLAAALAMLAGGLASIAWWWAGSGGTFFPGLGPPAEGRALPRVSIIVPARNEADVVGPCLKSLATLDYPDLEVILVEGGSTDGTREVAAAVPGVTVLDEPPMPTGWVGKSWACHQGALAATGEYLLFTDADTLHDATSLRRAMHDALVHDADFLTGYTEQELRTPWERALMPPVFLLIATAVGGISTARMQDPDLAIANGQYLLFKRDAYARLGGHASVRGRMAEDLALARRAARLGVRTLAVGLQGEVRVRMYRRFPEMWRGWRKNTAEGMVHTAPVPFLVTGLTFLQGLGAAPLAAVAAISGAWPAAAVALGAYLLMTGRVIVSYRATTGVPWAYAMLHPAGFAFFSAVLTASLIDRYLGRGHAWKGRTYPVAPRKARR